MRAESSSREQSRVAPDRIGLSSSVLIVGRWTLKSDHRSRYLRLCVGRLGGTHWVVTVFSDVRGKKGSGAVGDFRREEL